MRALIIVLLASTICSGCASPVENKSVIAVIQPTGKADAASLLAGNPLKMGGTILYVGIPKDEQATITIGADGVSGITVNAAKDATAATPALSDEAVIEDLVKNEPDGSGEVSQ